MFFVRCTIDMTESTWRLYIELKRCSVFCLLPAKGLRLVELFLLAGFAWKHQWHSKNWDYFIHKATVQAGSKDQYRESCIFHIQHGCFLLRVSHEFPCWGLGSNSKNQENHVFGCLPRWAAWVYSVHVDLNQAYFMGQQATINIMAPTWLGDTTPYTGTPTWSGNWSNNPSPGSCW